MKELVYTGIFVGLGLLLIVLLIIMFYPRRAENSTADTLSGFNETASYKPGIYNSELQLGNATLNLELVVDESQIKSVSLVNLDDSVTTMYPLVKPSLASIEEALIAGTPIDEIRLTEKSKYTQTMLIDGIRQALDKARN